MKTLKGAEQLAAAWAGRWPDQADLAEEIIARYDAPQRHYHNLDHIAELLGYLGQYRHLAVRPERLELAIWFHDIIYEPLASNNEEKSADLFLDVFHGLSSADREWVARAIRLSKEHLPSDDPDLQLFMDLDLLPLANPWEEFMVKGGAVRREYADVPDALYEAGRRHFFNSFLERKRIFGTGEISCTHEKNARDNLSRWLENNAVGKMNEMNA